MFFFYVISCLFFYYLIIVVMIVDSDRRNRDLIWFLKGNEEVVKDKRVRVLEYSY